MTSSDHADDLAALADDYWQSYLAASPTEAHLLGDHRFADQYEGLSAADDARRVTELRAFAERAEAIDPTTLGDQERLTRSVLLADARTGADVIEAGPDLGADPIFGPQASLPIVVGMLALPDADVAEAMVEKLRGVARSYRDLADKTRDRSADGQAPAAFAVSDTVAQLDDLLAGAVADDPVLAAVGSPIGVSDAEAVRAWRDRLATVVEQDLRPAMAAYRDTLRDDVLPHARPDDTCGLGAVRGGAEIYAAALRASTTTDKSAEEIHEIGRRQIAQLAEEYRELGPEVVGTDDLEQVFDRMRTDPALHFTAGEELVVASEVAMARAWDAMPAWFETLPQARCVVQPTTSGAKAFYFPPAADGSRGGTFFINVADPTSWGTFELESMAFHEGIPGHHLQLAIAGELTGVPEFRKHLHNNAYAEGWGLYTERLADEMGLYSSPVARMGMLSADSMRACRLVVDTGIHALGWSRQQAVDYMLENSPLAEGVVRPEIDRYVVTPGQACGYMIGRLEIERMRAEAEARQGASFEVKAFHSAVLDSGSLPLDVLDEVVRARLS